MIGLSAQNYWVVDTLELDVSIPLTAARSQNTGIFYLVQTFPDLEYIQFIDCDWELIPVWVELAIAEMKKDETLEIVCGGLQKRSSEASIYNRLADMEWNMPVGEAKACGGDSLVRVAAIQAVAGFNDLTSRLSVGKSRKCASGCGIRGGKFAGLMLIRPCTMPQ